MTVPKLHQVYGRHLPCCGGRKGEGSLQDSSFPVFFPFHILQTTSNGSVRIIHGGLQYGKKTSTTTATVFGMNCTEIIICRVWPSQRKKYTPSVSGAESTSSTSENIALSSTPIWFSAASCTAISMTLIVRLAISSTCS